MHALISAWTRDNKIPITRTNIDKAWNWFHTHTHARTHARAHTHTHTHTHTYIYIYIYIFHRLYLYFRFINQTLDLLIKYKWILNIKKAFSNNKYILLLQGIFTNTMISLFWKSFRRFYKKMHAFINAKLTTTKSHSREPT